MSASCGKDDNDLDGAFSRYAKILLKSFVLITTIIFLAVIKKKYLTADASIFYFAVFICMSTPIFSIIGLVDGYVFNNIAVGMGIAIGMHIMDF